MHTIELHLYISNITNITEFCLIIRGLECIHFLGSEENISLDDFLCSYGALRSQSINDTFFCAARASASSFVDSSIFWII